MEFVFVIIFMLVVIAVIVIIDYYRVTHLRNCPKCGHRMSLQDKIQDLDSKESIFVFHCPHCNTIHKVLFDDLLTPEKP